MPLLVVEDPRSVLGRLAAQLYGEPARALTLMAVTGTQGKTTTTRLLEGGLTTAGVPSAVIGTVGTRIAGQDVKTALTTPEAPDLHALFAVMVEQGVVACAMEVSSHALVMGRVAGVVFDVAAFLNLGRDHLDFHADVEDYFAAKASLFTPERARRGLTNVDDEFGRRLLDVATIEMVTFSPSGAEADWRAVGRRPAARGLPLHRGDAGRRGAAGVGAADRGRSTSPTRCARSRSPARRASTRARSPTASPTARACPDGSSGSTPARTSWPSSTTPTSPTRSRPRCPRSGR